MSALFAAAELTAATGGRWLDVRRPAAVAALYTDTREAGAGRIFLALHGERFDAHDFLIKAVENGAGALIVEETAAAKVDPAWGLPVLLVADTLRAYQALGRLHRLRFPRLTVAAVTGSVGKTSVKEMLRAIFSAAAGAEAVLFTEGNTNNQVGVVQNLLRLTPGHRYAVIEMGTNHHGEIEPLSRTALPHAAVVNSIAPCHLEFLGSLAGVATEKGHIFDGLQPSGMAVIPQEAAAVEVLAARTAELPRRRFGTMPGPEVAVWAEYCRGDLDGSEVLLHFASGATLPLRWELTGAHQAVNAAGAAALAEALGISPEVIVRGLADTRLPGMRMARCVRDGVTYVNDAYNANPASMRASFRQLAEALKPASLILVLGDMLELGAAEAAEHAGVLRDALAALPGARVLTVGPRFYRAAAGLDGVATVADSDAARPVLAALVRSGDTVFLKGSRGLKLEKTF